MMNSDSNNIFSVVIPARNEDYFIQKCLKGIARQDFDINRVEVIVVDNASTDQTAVIAREAGARVIASQSGTIGALRNRGAAMSRGKYLAFIDADCIPDPLWLKNALSRLAGSDFFAVGSKPVLPRSGTTWVEEAWSFVKGVPTLQEVKWLSSCNFIVDRQVFEGIGGFDETLETCEDADIGFRISKNWKLLNDPAVRVVHLREPKTIKEFFFKEVWHGRSNFRGAMQHGLVLNELPSLILPVWTLMSLMLLFAGVLLFRAELIVSGVVLVGVPPLVLSLRAYQKKQKGPNPLRVLSLYSVYCFARMGAIFATLQSPFTAETRR